MITVIRRHLQGTLSKVILWITILAIAGIFSVPTLLRKSSNIGPWFVRVNDEEISHNEYAREVEEKQQRISAFRAQYGQYADMLFASMGIDLDPKKLALNDLIRKELINQTADKIGLYLHPKYIVDKLNDPTFVIQELSTLVPPYVFDETGAINQRALNQHLLRMGVSTDQFERSVERALISNVIMQFVDNAFYLPNFDLKQHFIAENMRKKFSILAFSFNDVLQDEKQTEIGQQELKDFYDRQNAQYKRYWVPEKRSGTMWEFAPSNYGITITDDEIKEYYDKNKTTRFVDKPIQIQVRRILFKVENEKERGTKQSQAQEVYRELMKDPSKFEQFAKDYSQDKETASNGGIMPFFAIGEQDPSFDRASFLLKNDGNISEVIETKQGFEIIQRVEKKPQSYKLLNSLKNEIKDTLMNKKFSEQFVNDIKKVIDKKNESALQSFIKEKGGKPQTVEPQEITQSKLAQALFKLNLNESTFYVKNKVGHVVTLMDIQKRNLPPLNAIKKIVENDLYRERAEQRIKAMLDNARKSAVHESFESLQKTFGGSIETTKLISREDQDSLKSLEKRGVPINRMLQMEKVGSVIGHMGDLNGYLMRLDEIESFDQDAFNEKKDELKQKMTEERKRTLIEGFVASLYRSATIKINDEMLLTQE